MSEWTDADIREAVAAVVREARLELGMTQAEVGKKVGLSRVTITNIEGGRYLPTVLCLVRLCETLELSPNEVLGWEE